MDPPMTSAKGARAETGRKFLETFAFDIVESILEQERANYSGTLYLDSLFSSGRF
jgi:hypothetical protein